MFKLGLMLAPLWFFAQWTYVTSLADTRSVRFVSFRSLVILFSLAMMLSFEFVLLTVLFLFSVG